MLSASVIPKTFDQVVKGFFEPGGPMVSFTGKPGVAKTYMVVISRPSRAGIVLGGRDEESK